MANAEQTAPLTQTGSVGLKKIPSNPKGQKEIQYLSKELNADRLYEYELAVENMERSIPVYDMVAKRAAPHRKYKPLQNVVLSSQIDWDGSRLNIRYYDGCESIFVSEQPQDKDLIKSLIEQTRKFNFENGKLQVWGSDSLLILFLNICSWNVESPFRTKRAWGVFKPIDKEKDALAKDKRFEDLEKALEFARKATKNKMVVHGAYLGIGSFDYDTQTEKTDKVLRSEYREKAAENPTHFIKTYGDVTLETKYYIRKAWEDGIINNKINPNKATWQSSGAEVCDISGLTSGEAICETIFNFSKTELGEEFVVQLKAIFAEEKQSANSE